MKGTILKNGILQGFRDKCLAHRVSKTVLDNFIDGTRDSLDCVVNGKRDVVVGQVPGAVEVKSAQQRDRPADKRSPKARIKMNNLRTLHHGYSSSLQESLLQVPSSAVNLQNP